MRFLLPALLLVLTGLTSPLSHAAPEADKPTVFITGANRGLGLEFVRQFSGRDWNVIATVRDPADATDLQALAKKDPQIVIEKLDVTDHPGIDALAKKYAEQPIDVLISNAGKTPRYMSAFKPASGVDYQAARDSFEVNALAPLKLAAAFLPHVAASKEKKIIFISSKAGSFAEGPQMAMMYEYRTSKAAMNMIVHTLSFETKRKGVTIAALSPGSVNTPAVEGELGADGKLRNPGAIEPPESISGMMRVIENLKPEQNGQFLDYEDGRVIPW